MKQPCATCPFRIANHGRKHPARWYTKTNIMRLWNGLRSGKAPGMVCHSTDPKNREYGGDKDLPPGVTAHECIGANILVARELKALEDFLFFTEYRKARPWGLTLPGLRHWANRILFGGGVPTGEPTDEVGLPK